MKTPHRSLLVASAMGMACALTVTACNGSSSKSSSSDKFAIRAMLPPNSGQIDSAQTDWNATMTSQASGGSAPDIVWEQYNPLLSGSTPRASCRTCVPG